MFRKFELTFPPECAEYISSLYGWSQLIIEYGSGGSTYLAAELGSTVLTVESSSAWLAELMGTIQEADLPGHVVPIWANVGETTDWGYPCNNERVKYWHEYALLPWRYCSEHGLTPDTILIDGRFRTACFLAAAVAINKPVTLLFDDYGNREWYQWVEEIVQPSETVGRLAVFEIEPGMVDAGILLANVHAFTDPR